MKDIWRNSENRIKILKRMLFLSRVCVKDINAFEREASFVLCNRSLTIHNYIGII